MGNVSIVEVTNKALLRKFVDLPNKMYRDSPEYVPSFYSDDLSDWDRNKNPAFAHCEARAFLAYKDGKIVGRIGAILNYKANEKWGTNRMRFSQVDFIDDEEVADALFAEVENWAKEKGCTQVHGPLGFCDLDKEGMLVEGFDRESMFVTYYNHPYYNDHLQRLGYQKDTDWVEYKIYVPKETDEIYHRISDLAALVLKRNNLHIAKPKRRSDYRQYVRSVFELVNEAYSQLYGTMELSREQIEKYAEKFIPLVNPDFLCLVMDEEEKLAGFGVCCLSMEAALKKCHGKLFPFGWVGILRSLKKSTSMDLLLIAVRPELQRKGVNAIIIDYIMKNCIKNHVVYAESGPQLEENSKVLSQWRQFRSEQHKRRRCYVKELV